MVGLEIGHPARESGIMPKRENLEFLTGQESFYAR